MTFNISSEGDTKLAKNTVRKWALQVACCFAAKDFRKIINFQKFIKNLSSAKCQVFGVFSSRLGRFAIACTRIP